MLRKVYSAPTASPARLAAFCWLVAQVRALLRPQAGMRGLFPNEKLLACPPHTNMLLAIYEQEIFGTRLLTLLLTVRNKADKTEGRFWSVQHVRMQALGVSRLSRLLP
ncbi:hypothetical protein LI328DRAFT_171886 [Trichoderma asperelloides]|nr:hypothetical protein LI328DRAFT_171886 [Trichoderma asperelloides]